MPARGKDQRRHPRVRVKRPVQLHLEETTAYGAVTALNLAVGGICVARAPKAPVGERVYCRLLFAGQEQRALPARVVWTRDVDHGLADMGLAFEALGAEAQKMVTRLIKHLRGGHRSSEGVALPGRQPGARAYRAGESSTSQWRALAIGVSLGLLAVIGVALWKWLAS